MLEVGVSEMIGNDDREVIGNNIAMQTNRKDHFVFYF